MFKRIPATIFVALFVVALTGCASSDPVEPIEPAPVTVAPSPAPEAPEGTEVWGVIKDSIDISEVEEAFKDAEASPDEVVDAALGVLAISHLGGDVLHYPGWKDADMDARYAELEPFVSPRLWTKVQSVKDMEDLEGSRTITLPLLPQVPKDGLLVNYDLTEYHTTADKPLDFILQAGSVKVGTDNGSDSKDYKSATVEFTVGTIIDTEEGEQISFGNQIIFYMIPVEDTWVLDDVEWVADQNEVMPDSEKLPADDVPAPALEPGEGTVLKD